MNLFFTFLSPFLSFNDYKLFVMDPIIRIPDIINPRVIFRVVILGFLLSVMGAGISYGQSAPEVSGIPDQSIMEGSSFATINLDDYVKDVDNVDTELTWITQATLSFSNYRRQGCDDHPVVSGLERNGDDHVHGYRPRTVEWK